MVESAELYLAYLKGDKSKIADIVVAYRDDLQRFLLSLSKNEAVAEDITQETFLKLFTKRPKYKSAASFKTWLFTIGRNLMLNELKRLSRNGELAEEVMSLPMANDPLEKLTENEEARQLREAMEKLKPEYREVLYLTYFEEMSNKETAAVIGKKLGATEMLLSRARASLKEQMIKDGFEYEN